MSVPYRVSHGSERMRLVYKLKPPSHTEVCSLHRDTQTDILPGYPERAICVQRFDDSLNSAIHITYRNWLRSSSMHEPRDPPLEVVCLFVMSLIGTKVCWVNWQEGPNSAEALSRYPLHLVTIRSGI